MGELLLELNRRDSLKKQLGSLEDQAVPTVVHTIADNIEILVNRLALENRTRVDKPPVIRSPKVNIPLPEPPSEAPRLVTSEPKVESGIEQVEESIPFGGGAFGRYGVRQSAEAPVEEAVPEISHLIQAHSPEEVDVPVRSRIPYTVPDDALIYLHAASLIGPEEKPADAPFMLEEKGIDSRHFAFAWDCKGLRYYLSLLPPDVGSVGRGGALLLSKRDGMRLRGVHESVLNDFRLHGILLPFSFGTVVEGWAGFKAEIEKQSTRISEAVRLVAASKWWTVTVSVLDARFMELQQSDTPEKRRAMDRHRTSYTSNGPTGRMDLKTLERILTKQRRLAETIHHELEPLSDRAEVRSMVTLQSGTSDEWKTILKATYEIRPSIVNRFYRLVTDIQYQHFLQELMIAMTGDIEKINIGESRS